MTFRTIPVSLFLMEIITPGITAPLASVTVPESVAPLTCAFAGTLGERVIAKTTQIPRRTRNVSEKSLIVSSTWSLKVSLSLWERAARQPREARARQGEASKEVYSNLETLTLPSPEGEGGSSA